MTIPHRKMVRGIKLTVLPSSHSNLAGSARSRGSVGRGEGRFSPTGRRKITERKGRQAIRQGRGLRGHARGDAEGPCQRGARLKSQASRPGGAPCSRPRSGTLCVFPHGSRALCPCRPSCWPFVESRFFEVAAHGELVVILFRRRLACWPCSTSPGRES